MTVTGTSSAEKDGKTGRFLPGNTGFTGRPKGSRNHLTTEFLDDLRAAWATHGSSALERCAIEDPTQFCRIVASLLPRQAELDVSIGVDVVGFAAKYRHAVSLLEGADPDHARPIGYRHPKVIDHER